MWDSIKRFFDAIIDFFYKLFMSFIDFMKDFFLWLVDQLLSIGIFFLELLGGMGEAFNPVTYIQAIPEETKMFLAMCGFNEVMAIIIPAIIIKITLQLIPFVRLGS